MGLKKLVRIMVRANPLQPPLIFPQQKRAVLRSPRVYHQIGKYKISPRTSRKKSLTMILPE
jgi:hypothetical protein